MTNLTIRNVDPDAQRTVLLANALFIQLRGATAAQIDAYLVANAGSFAGLRPVLLMVLEAVSYLVNRENQTL